MLSAGHSNTARVGQRRPILVLGLGNVLLSDDGVGQVLMERLGGMVNGDPRVELLDGGTQGIGLVPYVAGRRCLLILDAVALGAVPGTVHVVNDPASLSANPGVTAHESNATSLLAAASLLGECPGTVRIVGIEPGTVKTGIGLSAPVARSIDRAARAAGNILRSLVHDADLEEAACTR